MTTVIGVVDITEVDGKPRQRCIGVEVLLHSRAPGSDERCIDACKKKPRR